MNARVNTADTAWGREQACIPVVPSTVLARKD